MKNAFSILKMDNEKEHTKIIDAHSFCDSTLSLT